MQEYSRLVRRWIKLGKILVRLMHFPKSLRDPEARMMLEGILEGNIDSIIKKKTMNRIVASANRGKTV